MFVCLLNLKKKKKLVFHAAKGFVFHVKKLVFHVNLLNAVLFFNPKM